MDLEKGTADGREWKRISRALWAHRLIAFALFAFGVAGFSAATSPEIEYAKNFEIEVFETHRQITVRNTWVGAGETTQRYALVSRNDPLPKLPVDAILVRTPVKRLVIMNTVFLGFIEELDLHETLVGIANPEFSHNRTARERVAKGLAKRVQSESSLDIESMILLQPDLILTSTTGNSTFDLHPQLLRAKLPVAVTAEYMEEHPLARLEWIKFLAAFFNKDAEAEAVFERAVKRYEELVDLIGPGAKRPTVFAGAPYGGVWHVPGGRSYAARAFADAGASYLWSHNESHGGIAVAFESVLLRAGEADYWLHPSYYDSLEALLSADERFAAFRAVCENQVFNYTLRVNEQGGNDIFERGVFHPEEVLADLIKIFHPEVLPNHEFVFYERLP